MFSTMLYSSSECHFCKHFSYWPHLKVNWAFQPNDLVMFMFDTHADVRAMCFRQLSHVRSASSDTVLSFRALFSLFPNLNIYHLENYQALS
jgi:hypothetical protein